jgi:L-ascorbate metabolism protein UlaG (beta-lactamase superfamily)
MTGEDAVKLTRLIEPRVAIPIHYEGWKHFRDGKRGVERAIAAAPADTQARFRWLPIGEPAEI